MKKIIKYSKVESVKYEFSYFDVKEALAKKANIPATEHYLIEFDDMGKDDKITLMINYKEDIE